MRISTVFLAMDHSFSDSAPPVLFETMIFGGPLDGDEARYCTWQEAEAGHKKMVRESKHAELLASQAKLLIK